MENNEKKEEMSLGREIVKELGGDVAGLGAGLIIGGAALMAIEALPVGKGLKVIMKIGAYGLEIAGMYKVRDAVQDYIGNVFEAVDAVKEIFNGPKNQENPVKVEGAVQ